MHNNNSLVSAIRSYLYSLFFNMKTCISYKNIEAEICEILRINPRLRFEKDIILRVENL